MSDLPNPAPSADAATQQKLEYLFLMREIEDFINLEADVLDDRDFERWLTFFADDLRYWMPLRLNLPLRQSANDITADGDISWIDDDKITLSKRVAQIRTGVHWAEEPLSRVTHLISNIRLAGHSEQSGEYTVRSHFLVHRNRLETETDRISGRREDVLRRANGSFVIAKRKIIIDQTVLMAKNLTFFF